MARRGDDATFLLAGDVGGTKTILAVFSETSGPCRPLASRTFPSAGYPGLADMAKEFVATVGLEVDRACFDVAGPVVDGRVRPTNLEWPPLEEQELADALGLRSVRLLNDLEAVALGITALDRRQLRTLQRGRPQREGTLAVVAPGTGLGEAFVTREGGRWAAHPSEGGHCDFAPADDREEALLRHLRASHGHVSYELVCSGLGIANLYDFLADTGFGGEPPAVTDRIVAASDRTRAIVSAALEGASERCGEALQMFCGILGAEAGNLALKVLATGGIYLAGGLPPAVLPLLREGPFLARLGAKGRLSALVAAMPVRVVVTRAAIVGAAVAGFRRDEGGAAPPP